MKCVICHSKKFFPFDQYSLLKRVTSDCKPWASGGVLGVCGECGTIQKTIDEKWLGEISQIYKNYEAYYQADGEEQAVFASQGTPMKRSEKLIEFLFEQSVFQKKGCHILDYGCANGGFLRAVSDKYDEVELFGFDLSSKYESALKKIKNFKELFVGEIVEGKQFHLVSLIHTLEHVLDPVAILSNIKKYLHKEGLLFIQVPNIAENPFDILVADHLLHFTPVSLANVLKQAGFNIKELSIDVVAKEISVIAIPAQKNSDEKNEKNERLFFTNKVMIDEHLLILNKILKDVDDLSRKSKFAIFGTSICATWLHGYFNNIFCFVDEDPALIGKKHFGKTIYSPSQLSPEIPVYIPLPAKVVKLIKARLNQQLPKLLSPYE